MTNVFKFAGLEVTRTNVCCFYDYFRKKQMIIVHSLDFEGPEPSTYVSDVVLTLYIFYHLQGSFKNNLRIAIEGKRKVVGM